MKLATMANYGDKGVIYAEYDSATGMSSGYVEVGGAKMPIGAFDYVICNDEVKNELVLYSGDWETVKSKILNKKLVVGLLARYSTSGYVTYWQTSLVTETGYNTGNPTQIGCNVDGTVYLWSDDGSVVIDD